MKKIIPFYIVYFALFSSCNYPSQNESEKTPFFSLQIGNVTQLIDPSDSSTFLISIIGKEIRPDGQEGYVQISKYGTMRTYTDLVFFRDGFLVYSQLDTVKDSSGNFNQFNPFFEHRMSFEIPSDNQKWLQTPNDSNYSDIFIHCYSIGNYLTFAGLFKNAFEYQLWDSDDSSCIMKTIYCKDIGLAGAESCQDSVLATLSYAKIGSTIYGHQLPDKDPPESRLNKLFLFKHTFLFKPFWL